MLVVDRICIASIVVLGCQHTQTGESGPDGKLRCYMFRVWKAEEFEIR
jgi:hypothetical protein